MKLRWLVPLLLFAVGCSSPRTDAKSDLASSEASKQGAMLAAAEAPPGNSQSLAPVQARQVIRTAAISIRVPKIGQAERQIQLIADEFRGYVEGSNSSDLASGQPSMTLTFRVPVRAFPIALEKLQALGIVLSKTIRSDDVTSQLVDFDARLKTLGAQEDALREILRRAKTISDTIQLQDRLTQIRTEIETISAQRKSLAGQAQMCSISLNLTQDAVPNAKGTDPNWLAQDWAQSTTLLSQISRSVISALVYAGVLTPLWCPILLMVLWWSRSRRVAPR